MEPGIDLEPASGELTDEVDSAGAGFADDIHERSVGVEINLSRELPRLSSSPLCPV